MSKRGELLKDLSVRKFSLNMIEEVSNKYRGMTDSMKEEKSEQMLTMLNNSKDEQDFISKLEKPC